MIPKKMIISHNNSLLRTWESIPMGLSIYNALIIPFEISFGLPFWFIKVNWYCDIIIDILFLIDNII